MEIRFESIISPIKYPLDKSFIIRLGIKTKLPWGLT